MTKLISAFLVILSSLFLLSGCSSSSSNYGYYDDYEYEDSYGDEEDVVTSDNWDCTGDCSGHEAGYEWASDNGITNSYDCGGNSDSFIEGCEAYANEYQMENEEEEYYEDDYGYEY